MQTLRLNCFLHEIRLRDYWRDRQAHRHGHAAQRRWITREAIVLTVHVARVEVRVRPHGREVKRVDTGLGQHEDTNTGCLAPDAVQIVPGRVPGRAGAEDGAEELPHVVHAGVDIGGEERGEVLGLLHVVDGFGAGD